jgi:hypothetical protein
MSTRINLEFQTKIDLDFISYGVKVLLIRLIGNVHLKNNQNWSTEEKVIIDTGNPISIIPYSVWQNIERKVLVLSKTKLYGLGSSNEIALSGQLAVVTIVFKDEKNVSKPLKIKANLLDDDNAPFLIGYEDILTQSKLVSDYKNNISYIEFF